MQKKDEYCITAGEFAKMCQTTRDTLRYYERQGILVPKKNPVNGYHYYSYAQISSYYFIRTFRELDCSVQGHAVGSWIYTSARVGFIVKIWNHADHSGF